jgi:calcineurin-like phosphoesterase family protein
MFEKGDVLTMNEVLVRNWNNVVSNHDTVFFLGDLLPQWYEPFYFKRFFHYTDERLKGKIICIKGNHEEPFGRRLPRFKPLRYKGINFLLIHDLATIKEIKKDYDFSNFRYDWVIHGHVHNNKMGKYPFINGEKKTINVSCEVLQYFPLDFDHLISLNLNSIKRMNTISGPIIRK